MYKAHNYEEYTPETQPADPGMDGAGWTFETGEHAIGVHGEAFPLVIYATDAEGRKHTYSSTDVGGKPVDSKGYVFDSAPGSKVIFRDKETASA
jgi:hypothetical protein